MGGVEEEGEVGEVCESCEVREGCEEEGVGRRASMAIVGVWVVRGGCWAGELLEQFGGMWMDRPWGLLGVRFSDGGIAAVALLELG